MLHTNDHAIGFTSVDPFSFKNSAFLVWIDTISFRTYSIGCEIQEKCPKVTFWLEIILFEKGHVNKWTILHWPWKFYREKPYLGSIYEN